MGNRIICIGREFGSGGHQIALLLGQKLGLKVYEKDILHMACKYGDLQVSKMEASDEKATNPYLFETVHEGNYHVMRGLPTSEVLFALQQHEIKRIAQKDTTASRRTPRSVSSLPTANATRMTGGCTLQ